MLALGEQAVAELLERLPGLGDVAHVAPVDVGVGVLDRGVVVVGDRVGDARQEGERGGVVRHVGVERGARVAGSGRHRGGSVRGGDAGVHASITHSGRAVMQGVWAR